MRIPLLLGGLAATLLLGLPAPVRAQGDPPLAERLLDAFEGVFGRNPGVRRSGAKGFCAVGEWVGTGAGTALSRAAGFRDGVRAPVHARFSLGGGNPHAPDNAPGVRGLSLSIEGPAGEPHEFVLINTPVFTARTPESMLAFLAARAVDPATRQMDAARVAAANAAHPDWAPQMAYLRETPPPASFATTAYFGVNSFVFVAADGTRRHARWTFEPVAGRIGLSMEERAVRGPRFLEAELRERLARGPAEWRVLLQLPEAGDPIDDAVAAWPDNRRTLEVARLRITGLVPEGERAACDARVFYNPTLLPEGIEPSDDPILAIRAEVYAVALGRRTP